MATIQINKTDGSIFTYELQAGETYTVAPWAAGQGGPLESDIERMVILVSDAQGNPSQTITATRYIAQTSQLNPSQSNFPGFIQAGMQAFIDWDPNAIPNTQIDELFDALSGEALANAIDLAYQNDDGGTGLMQEALYWMDPTVYNEVEAALSDWSDAVLDAGTDINNKLTAACNAGQDGIRVNNLGFIACGTSLANIGEAIVPLPEIVKAHLHVAKVAMTYSNVAIAAAAPPVGPI